jgi:apolipoprotein D and lipocalin family protein
MHSLWQACRHHAASLGCPELDMPMNPTPHPMNAPSQWASQATALKMAAGLLALALSVCASTGPALAEPVPLQTVPSVDVPRYMGTWYEIAKYPNWFQNKCVSSTQATYTLQADGRVQVRNRCKTDKGEWSEALGAARQIGGPNSPRLKVRFAPEWLSFIPVVWGDYWIIDLDPDYQWVVVSEPDRAYLWILSRTPQMPATTYQDLLGKLHDRGFDLKRIEPSRP